jgi:hypothetical protein
MSFNLFYDLPGDVQHIIHKKVYTLEVMEQLKNRPGNFSWMEKYLTKNLENRVSLVYKLDKDYRSIEKLGPKAWEYMKTSSSNYFERFSNHSIVEPMIFYEIYYTLYDNHVEDVSFRGCFCHIQMIAEMGWDGYKKHCIKCFELKA